MTVSSSYLHDEESKKLAGVILHPEEDGEDDFIRLRGYIACFILSKSRFHRTINVIVHSKTISMDVFTAKISNQVTDEPMMSIDRQ